MRAYSGGPASRLRPHRRGRAAVNIAMFDLSKVGIGTSSSHTTDPMRQTGADMQDEYWAVSTK